MLSVNIDLLVNWCPNCADDHLFSPRWFSAESCFQFHLSYFLLQFLPFIFWEGQFYFFWNSTRNQHFKQSPLVFLFNFSFLFANYLKNLFVTLNIFLFALTSKNSNLTFHPWISSFCYRKRTVPPSIFLKNYFFRLQFYFFSLQRFRNSVKKFHVIVFSHKTILLLKNRQIFLSFFIFYFFCIHTIFSFSIFYFFESTKI